MLPHTNSVTINGKIHTFIYLNKTESMFLECLNEGYVLDGVAVIGYCDCPIWETIVTWHELGHLVLDTNDEVDVWKWTLKNLPVVIPENYRSIINGRIRKWSSPTV